MLCTANNLKPCQPNTGFDNNIQGVKLYLFPDVVVAEEASNFSFSQKGAEYGSLYPGSMFMPTACSREAFNALRRKSVTHFLIISAGH